MPLLMTYGEIGFRANLPGAWVDITDWLDGVPLDGDTPRDALHRLFRGACRARVGKEPGMRASDLTRSQFGTAEAYAEEAYQLAVETGQANAACKQQSMRAWLAALQGRADDARALAEEVLAQATERQLPECLAYAHHTLGHIHLMAGAYPEAVHHYEAMDPRAGGTVQSGGPALHTMAELVEALVRSDQRERAADQATRFARWADQTASPELHALTARCRALLASGDEAEEEYRRRRSCTR